MFSKAFFSNLSRYPEALVNNRKLDTALRQSPIDCIKSRLKAHKNVTLQDKILLLNVSKDTILDCETGESVFSMMYRKLLLYSLNDKGPLIKNDVGKRILQLVGENISLQHRWNVSESSLGYHGLSIRELELKLTKFKTLTQLESNFFWLEHQLGLLVEKSGLLVHQLRDKKNRENISLLKSSCTYSIREFNMHLSWNKNIVVIKIDNETFICPFQYIQLLHNKLCDIISTYYLIKFNQGVCYEESAVNILMEFLTCLCDLSITFKTKYHGIVKCLEAMAIGEILLSEEDWKNDELLKSLCDDLYENNFDYEGSKLRDLFCEASTPFKMELSALSKIFGHPFIKIEKTVKDHLKKVNCEKTINCVAIAETVLYAKHDFIRNFILKHKKWPEVTIHSGAPDRIIYSRLQNIDPYAESIKRAYGKTELHDFVFIDIDEKFKLDKLRQYSEYLKDKTISVCKHPLFQQYAEKNYGKDTWKNTRLLLAFLLYTEDHHDLEGYLEKYMGSTDDLEECLNYLVIKLVPKEKELKESGRPFGCKTYQDRYRMKVQEENVSHYMDKYVLDQSMTIDNLTMIKRLYRFRNMKKTYSGWRQLMVNFDVSGWNSNFRQETVGPIMKATLDKMFDTDLFSKTQKAYEAGFFYLPDESGIYNWVGQKGGIEGLNQYTWMLSYIPQMRLALSQFNLHFFVMAYGDDYKAVLLIPPDQRNLNIKDLKSAIVRTVTRGVIVNFGQKMKYYDSYGSEIFLSFCKNSSLGEVELPQGIRKIQKCYGANNAFLPTLDEYISSAFSNAHSAARTMPCYYGAYAVALVWSYTHLLRHSMYGPDLRDEVLHSCLFGTSVLGGLPTIYLHNFATRSESDHLTSVIEFTLWLKLNAPKIYNVMINYFSFSVLDSDNKYESLLRDPYSLPIQKPPLAASVLRNAILPILKPIVRNTAFRELVDALDDDASQILLDALTSSKSLQPRILSSIAACLPKAVIDEFIRRFENSGSIKDLLIMRRGKRSTLRVLVNVIRAEKRLQSWRVNRLANPNVLVDDHWPENTRLCSTQLADNLRKLWGKEIIGVTMPAIQHLVYLRDPEVLNDCTTHAMSNHFSYYFHPPEESLKNNNNSRDHWKCGKAKPFLGHKTRSGSEIPSVKPIESNPQIKKIETLLDAASWVDVVGPDENGVITNSNLPELIKIILSQYYTRDPRELLPYSALRKSGTISHHWRSPHYKEHIMPNTVVNTYTHWRGEVNTHINLRGSPDHHTVNFLQILCHTINLLSVELQYRSHYTTRPEKIWCVTTSCKYCMRPIREPPIVVKLPKKLSVGRTLQMTKLDDFSQDILAESLAQYHAKRYRLDIEAEHLSLETSALGACQKFIDQSVRINQGVINRFEAMPSTENVEALTDLWGGGGEATLVRQREIRHIPPYILCESLCSYIYISLLKKFRNSDSDSISCYIITEHPNVFPWTKLFVFIDQAGMLPALVRAGENISGMRPPVCYSNPIAASKYFATISIPVIESGKLTPRVVILSYYENDELEPWLNNLEYLQKLRMIQSLISGPLNTLIDNKERVKFLLICLYTLCCTHMREIDDIMEDVTQATLGTGAFLSVDMLEYDPPTRDDYDAETENPQSILNRTLRNYRKLYKIQTHVDYLLVEQEYENVNEYLVNESERFRSNITRAVLANCLTTIRTGPDYLIIPPSDTGTVAPDIRHERHHAIIIPLFHVDILGEDVPDTNLFDVNDNFDIYTTEELVLTQYQTWRPFSVGTSSFNKLIEIEHIIGIRFNGMQRAGIACLGEGYGGIIAYLAKISKYCHFLYNTIPVESESLCQPELAIEYIRGNNHTLDISLIQSGIYDLTKCVTIIKLIENDDNLYSIITCDAELSWNDLIAYRALLFGVCHFWLVKRSVGGLLILKVFLEPTRLVCEIMSLLSHYSREVKLVRLNSSPPGSECYIIAQGARKIYDRKAITISSKICPSIGRQVTGMVEAMRASYSDMFPHKNITLYLFPLPHRRYLQQFISVFTPSFVQTITAKHNILINWNHLYQLPQAQFLQTFIVAIKTYNQNLKRQMAHFGKNLNTKWANDTHAGLLRLSERFLFTESLLIHSKTILQEGIHTVTQGRIRQEFLNACREIPARCQIFSAEQDIFNKEPRIVGNITSAYYQWLEGFYAIIHMFCYFTIRY